MKRTIITISREYGSGGRKIGELVAEQLNIPCYNHNLIDMVAHETGMASSYIENWEEQVTSPRLWGIPMIGSLAGAFMENQYYTNEDRMFEAQSKIIHRIAESEHGSSVIVGRCADYLLRDDPGLLKVFIYAPEEKRLERIRSEYGTSDPEESLRHLRFVDKGRAAYVRKYACMKWGDNQNYHLLIDSGAFTLETAAGLIVQAAKSRD